MSATEEYRPTNPSFKQSNVAETIGRDMTETAAQLRDLVSRHVAGGAPVEVENLKLPVGAGNSNETILFDARWTVDGVAQQRGMVLRIAPNGYQLFKDPRIADQYRLMQVLTEIGKVRVATPLHFDGGTEPFGAPYFLMGKLDGFVPVTFPPYNSAGKLFDATIAQRRTAWESAMEQLCEIALTPLDEVAFLADNPDDGDFDAHFRMTLDECRWSKADHVPIIAQTEQWLIANKPKNPPAGLSWGDARIGNMMIGPDFQISGVMDWEQLSLGGALLDLGWWLFFDAFHSVNLGLTRLEGLGTRDETLAYFRGRTGIDTAEVQWYEVLAGYKLALIMARKLIMEKSSDPGNNANNNIITIQLARSLGIEAPGDVIEEIA
ncbi:phosphotransferase family protein [Sphingomonas montanisoli]|uniref:Phosphotransferase family protein n=1 Tax=Sphingomonas montanisoli TaxID=2606412 RepID=A0A5D9C803_9SPHN|nr:phosphotransferase family protein [Sphingomonas montanisoli]TZG27387.1 phosphotransferase family protein [Sphingomonas montanisoli]